MEKKKVVIFGASGRTGKYIVRRLQGMENVELTVSVRNPDKLKDIDTAGVWVVSGDALKPEDVEKAVQGQEIVLASLEGDVLRMAKNIVAACRASSVRRIIWITGMGIHHEIKGLRGMMLSLYAKKRPEYIEAADTIASSGITYTLLRCPGIVDGENTRYSLTPENVQPKKNSIDRAGIAKCMADMVNNEKMGMNESLGITN